MDGTRCPERIFQPRTPEGRAVLAVIDRPGVWLRGGMQAILLGLDLPHALASLPRGLDHTLATELLITAEAAFIAAAMARDDAEESE